VAGGVELWNGQHPEQRPADDVALLEARPRRRAAGHGTPGAGRLAVSLRPGTLDLLTRAQIC